MSNIAAVYLILLAAASHGGQGHPLKGNSAAAPAMIASADRAPKALRIAMIEPKRAGKRG